MVQLPDHPQAIQRKPGGDKINDLGLVRDDLGESSGGDDLHIASQLRPEPGNHTLDHAHISVQ